MPDRFACYLVEKDSAGKTKASVARASSESLPPGGVLVGELDPCRGCTLVDRRAPFSAYQARTSPSP